jgi:hypothetical protein
MSDISVLLCAHRETIEEFEVAIRSIIFQTHLSKQIIIVDDSGEFRYKSICEQFYARLCGDIKIDLTIKIGDIVNENKRKILPQQNNTLIKGV